MERVKKVRFGALPKTKSFGCPYSFMSLKYYTTEMFTQSLSNIVLFRDLMNHYCFALRIHTPIIFDSTDQDQVSEYLKEPIEFIENSLVNVLDLDFIQKTHSQLFYFLWDSILNNVKIEEELYQNSSETFKNKLFTNNLRNSFQRIF